MEATNAAGRRARDAQLTRAGAILLVAGVLAVISYSMRLATVLDSRDVDPASTVASALDVVSRLPGLAAFALGALSFLSRGEIRSRRLRQAFLLAALAYGIDFLAGMLIFGGLENPAPDGFQVGLLVGALSSFGLSAGFLIASAGFQSRSTVEQREQRLSWAAALAGAAFLLAAISSLEFARAYSHFPSHNEFVRGYVLWGLGEMGTAFSAWLGVTAFRRSPGLRERRLYITATTLAISLVVTAVGQCVAAEGTVSIGYSESAAVADWIFASVTCLLAVAVICAAIGFSRAATPPD
jgi:hypothetical protein